MSDFIDTFVGTAVFIYLPLAIIQIMIALNINFALKVSPPRALLFGALVGGMSFLGLEIIQWIQQGISDYILVLTRPDIFPPEIYGEPSLKENLIWNFDRIFIWGSELSWANIYFDILHGSYDWSFAVQEWWGIQLIEMFFASIGGAILVLEGMLLKSRESLKKIGFALLIFTYIFYYFAIVYLWEHWVYYI